jgi:hypothetical protein
MDNVEKSLRALEQARQRKKDLKRLLGVLYEEYKLVKTEIKLHEKLLENWMAATEYAAFLDTIKIEPVAKHLTSVKRPKMRG